MQRRRAEFVAAAKADVARLNVDDQRLGRLALERVRALENREIEGEPLNDMASTGDLADCRKLKFGVGTPPSHRIVYRDLGPQEGIEILEIVAIESRSALYAYLLAASRLGRLPVESEEQFGRVHQQTIARRSRRQP